jgi:cytochrome c-type biogenesis protein CcsB
MAVILEKIFLFVSLASIVLALIFNIVGFILGRRVATGLATEKLIRTSSHAMVALNKAASVFIFGSLFFVTLIIVTRTIETGHAPFSSMYEFAVAFTWGILLAGIIFRRRYKTAAIQNMGLIVALLLTIFALVQFSKPASLVPALQQSALLSAHVASAVVAYGTLTIGFGAAVLFLLQTRYHPAWIPEAEVLDNISYRSAIIGFPFLTLLIVLGALWADIAWGSYWSWDPKETASLVTWLIYAGYMHARVMRGWRGTRAAILLIAGFAAILLTFFGNYIFSGLHSYG